MKEKNWKIEVKKINAKELKDLVKFSNLDSIKGDERAINRNVCNRSRAYLDVKKNILLGNLDYVLYHYPSCIRVHEHTGIIIDGQHTISGVFDAISEKIEKTGEDISEKIEIMVTFDSGKATTYFNESGEVDINKSMELIEEAIRSCNTKVRAWNKNDIISQCINSYNVEIRNSHIKILNVAKILQGKLDKEGLQDKRKKIYYKTKSGVEHIKNVWVMDHIIYGTRVEKSRLENLENLVLSEEDIKKIDERVEAMEMFNDYFPELHIFSSTERISAVGRFMYYLQKKGVDINKEDYLVNDIKKAINKLTGLRKRSFIERWSIINFSSNNEKYNGEHDGTDQFYSDLIGFVKK